MKLIILICLIWVGYVCDIYAKPIIQSESEKKILSQSKEYKIDSAIFYCNPIIMKNAVPINKENSPIWLQAFMVSYRPDLFENYFEMEKKYRHSSLGPIDSTKLMKFKQIAMQKSRDMKKKNIAMYNYFIGEIWLTKNETNERLLLVWQLNELDSIHDNLNLIKDYDRKRFVNTTNAHLYIFDEGILKSVGRQYTSPLMKYDFIDYLKFKKILEQLPTYKRSWLKDGKRIFETVKNTPNGPVVISQENKKQIKQEESMNSWYNKYWWVIAAGIVLLLLIAIVLNRRK